MGFAWGIAWGAVGSIPRWVLGFNPDAPFPLIFGLLGFMAGVIFFGLLVTTERRRTFDQLSLPRFATWGAIGGLLLSALFARFASLAWADLVVITPTFAIACAACASGSLALARRAPWRELVDSRGADADAQLAAREPRELPGGGN